MVCSKSIVLVLVHPSPWWGDPPLRSRSCRSYTLPPLVLLEGTVVDYTGVDVAVGVGGHGKNSGSVDKDGAYGSI